MSLIERLYEREIEGETDGQRRKERELTLALEQWLGVGKVWKYEKSGFERQQQKKKGRLDLQRVSFFSFFKYKYVIRLLKAGWTHNLNPKMAHLNWIRIDSDPIWRIKDRLVQDIGPRHQLNTILRQSGTNQKSQPVTWKSLTIRARRLANCLFYIFISGHWVQTCSG